MTMTYLSRQETANLVRQTLKRSFPGTKFSVRVRAYSGGSSCDIGWTDGPTEAQVDAVVQVYGHARFDGSIDMGYSVDTWLMPDGSAIIARDAGTEVSGGSRQGSSAAAPHPEATRVSMGISFVFARREHSPALLRRVLARLKATWGEDAYEGVEITTRGGSSTAGGSSMR